MDKAWDAYDAYLFDIDGTLLDCTDAVHYFAFCEALKMLSGRSLNLDGVVAHGNVDEGIVRDALLLAGVPEAEWRPRLPDAGKEMCAFVEARRADLRVTVLPGVREVLAYLRQKGAVLGVATGNLAGIGRAKLDAAKLLKSFDFGGYSDGFETRAEVFRAAAEQAQRLAGAKARLCVVGDTPRDVQAARANGVDVVAVATGVYSFAELLAEEPDRCVRSMTELMAT